jgi:hypothetical protein
MVESDGRYKIAGVLAALASSGLTLAVRVGALRDMGDWTHCP